MGGLDDDGDRYGCAEEVDEDGVYMVDKSALVEVGTTEETDSTTDAITADVELGADGGDNYIDQMTEKAKALTELTVEGWEDRTFESVDDMEQVTASPSVILYPEHAELSIDAAANS